MNAKSCRPRQLLVLLGVAGRPGLAQPTNRQSVLDARSAGATGAGRRRGRATAPSKGCSIAPARPRACRTDRQISRCADLTGTLREQCLAQEKGAASGGTTPPDADVVKPPTTREAPPPQNPQPRSN
jgi:hypothetical protein